MSEVYESEDFSLNFSRGYSTGNLSNAKIKNKLAHLITFDFDLYSVEGSVLEQFTKEPENGLMDMNKRIYNFFTDVVSEDVVTRIKNGESLEEYGVIPY